MNKTIELSTGKIVDLSRFVALIPNDEAAENHQYSLILEGYAQSINLNLEEANLVKKHLQVDTKKKHNGTWDREEQLRLNQPKMKKLKEIIERKKQEQKSGNPPTKEEIQEYQDIQESLKRNRFIEQTS